MVTLPCCPTCNRPFPPEIVVGGRVRQRVWEFIKAHVNGVTREQIIGHVYSEYPNGGPDSFNTISVHINQINKILKEQGAMMYISGRMGAHNDKYKLHYGVRK